MPGLDSHPKTKSSSSITARRTSIERSSRPSALKRKSTSSTSSALLLGTVRQTEQTITETLQQQQQPDMAASFLQYCAMCERMITTPSNSILYCSSACRRKDGSKPLSAASITSLTPPPSAPSSPKMFLAPRTPTGVISSPSNSDIPTLRIAPELHDYRPDLDPTEWKPKLPHNRKQSDAQSYLSRFHRTSYYSGAGNGDADDLKSPVSPMMFGTASSSLSTSGPGYMSSSRNASYGGYDFQTRPLPVRPNRWYSSSMSSSRGVDLVTPHIPPPSAAATATDAGMYEKKQVMFREDAARKKATEGNLSFLFG